MKAGDLESNNGSTNWWMGFRKFSLFEHSVVEEETTEGQDKVTKKKPWLVRIMTILWLVFSMMGLSPTMMGLYPSMKTAGAQSSKKGLFEEIKKSEAGQIKKQQTYLTAGNNLKGKAKDQPGTEAVQANNTETQGNWARGAE